MNAANMLLARADSGDNALSAFKYYYYEPSMPAAIIFIVLFGLTTILHIAQMATTRTWFMIPFVIGGICKLDNISTGYREISLYFDIACADE